MDDDDDFGRLDLTISEKDLLVDLIIVSGRDDIALDSKSTLGRLVVSSDILSLSKLNWLLRELSSTIIFSELTLAELLSLMTELLHKCLKFLHTNLI